MLLGFDQVAGNKAPVAEQTEPDPERIGLDAELEVADSADEEMEAESWVQEEEQEDVIAEKKEEKEVAGGIAKVQKTLAEQNQSANCLLFLVAVLPWSHAASRAECEPPLYLVYPLKPGPLFAPL